MNRNDTEKIKKKCRRTIKISEYAQLCAQSGRQVTATPRTSRSRQGANADLTQTAGGGQGQGQAHGAAPGRQHSPELFTRLARTAGKIHTVVMRNYVCTGDSLQHNVYLCKFY